MGPVLVQAEDIGGLVGGDEFPARIFVQRTDEPAVVIELAADRIVFQVSVCRDCCSADGRSGRGCFFFPRRPDRAQSGEPGNRGGAA